MQQLKYSKYLDLLSAAEQVYLLSCAEIEAAIDAELAELIVTHPILTYAIAMSDFQRRNVPTKKVGSRQKSLSFLS